MSAPAERTPSIADRMVAAGLEIAFGDWMGSTLVLGLPPPRIMAALAVQATEISVFAPSRRVRELRKDLAASSPVVINAIGADGAGLPTIESAHANLVVTDLAAPSAPDALERALLATADGGRVLIDIEAHPSRDRRLQRMLEAACSELGSGPGPDDPERFVRLGRRRAPYPEDLAHEPPGALPVSVIVITEGARAGLEPLLVDLLLRQTLPPCEVFVLDVGEGAVPAVPADLFGIQALPLTRVAVFPARGKPMTTAVNDALGGASAPFVAILDPGVHLGPNALACLGLTLENAPDSVVALGAGAWSTSAGEQLARDVSEPADPLLHELLAGRRFPLGAALFRVAALRALSGFDPELGPAAVLDLWLRVAERGRAVVCSLPVIEIGAPGPRPGPEDGPALRALVARGLRTTQATLPDADGLERRAAALFAAGEFELARADFGHSTSSSSLIGLARSEVFLGRFDEAERVFAAAARDGSVAATRGVAGLGARLARMLAGTASPADTAGLPMGTATEDEMLFDVYARARRDPNLRDAVAALIRHRSAQPGAQVAISADAVRFDDLQRARQGAVRP